MSEIYAVVGILGAFLIGAYIFVVHATTATRFTGVLGAISKLGWILLGLVIMQGGPVALAFGFIFATAGVVLFFANVDKASDRDLRKRLAGVRHSD